jgi:hypothetical protein
MTHLTPIQIDDNTIIYIESNELAEVPVTTSSEKKLVTYGGTPENTEKIRANFDRLKSTLTHYTLSTIDAFKQASNTDIANIDKVTLKFGIKIADIVGWVKERNSTNQMTLVLVRFREGILFV